MSALINFSLDVAALPKEKFVSAANGKVYINLTMSVNDETRYGNNTGIYVSQTQEEREAKKKKPPLIIKKIKMVGQLLLLGVLVQLLVLVFQRSQ